MKDRIVSGIQPTGELHIGNYLGSLKNFVELQNQGDCYFFVADLHALTGEFKSSKDFSNNSRNLVISMLAAGLDPKKCTIFVQSQVPAHTELAWIFNTITPIGELNRMTQFKDKAKIRSSNIILGGPTSSDYQVTVPAGVDVGLFDYPVLMAADILLYKPTHVPVGHDQIQHLELTNTISRKFNNKFGETFAEIKPFMQKPLRIMSLSDPERKMSKSEPGSFINMFDSPEEIKRKLAKAVTATDASSKEMPKGVANLIGLLEHFDNTKAAEQFKAEYKTGLIKYSNLKNTLADTLSEYFAPMREKRAELEQNPGMIDQVIAQGSAKAAELANQTLAEVKSKIGLI